MKPRGYLLPLACALAALAVPLAGTASAKPSHVVKPKSLSLKLRLPASNGYSASILTSGHRQVVLNLSKGSVFTRYTALGKVTRKGIEADFGSFGRVSLRFRGKHRFHPRQRGRCSGRRPVGESGVFVGRVRFRGERGFTRVRAHRLEGTVVRAYRRVCKKAFRASTSKVREEVALLTAEAKRAGVTRSFLVIEAGASVGGEEFSFSIAAAVESKKVGRVAVRKAAVSIEELDSVAVSPRGKRPLTAEVKLLEPFEGTATYLDDGSAPPTWEGTLGVRLPGSGLVPLAGPEFEVDFCSGSLEAFDDCVKAAARNQPLLYGSGSHSQPLALARLSSLR